MTMPDLAYVTVRESCPTIAAAISEQIPDLQGAADLLKTNDLRGTQPYAVAGRVDDATVGCMLGHNEERDDGSSMRLLFGGVAPEYVEHGVFGAMFGAFRAEALLRGHDKIVVRGNRFPAMLGALAEHGFGFAGHDSEDTPLYVRRLP